MLEKLIPSVAAVLLPILGLLLRASRRDRLRRRIEEHHALAEQFQGHDKALATRFHSLASEVGRKLAGHEDQRLRRRFDGGALAAVIFLMTPAVGVIAWAADWSSSWKWAVITVAVLWALMWGGVGVTQLWRDGSDEQKGK